MYRITSLGPAGTSRTMTNYPDEAIRQAQVAVADGRTEVWIADDDGQLFDVESFAKFIASQPSPK